MPGDRLTNHASAFDDSGVTIPAEFASFRDDHTYIRIASGAYIPQDVVALDDVDFYFDKVLDPVVAILKADAKNVDPKLSTHAFDASAARTLCRHAYAVAMRSLRDLDPPEALLAEHHVRYAAATLVQLGLTPAANEDHIGRRVRRLRRAYPAKYGTPRGQRKRKTPRAPHVAPTPDAVFDQALAATDGAYTRQLRDQARAALYGPRAAGLNNLDCRYWAADDVEDRRDLGVWIVVRAPGREREVPVLARFAEPIMEIAKRRPGQAMLWSGPTPTPEPQPVNMLRDVNMRLGLTPPHMLTAQSLSRAWQVEQFENGAVLVDVARLSCRGLTGWSWMADHVSPTEDPTVLAADFGAVDLPRRSR